MPSNNYLFKTILASFGGVFAANFTIFMSPLYIGSLIDGLAFTEVQAGITSTLEIGMVALTCLLLSGSLAQLSLRYLAIAGAILMTMANLLTVFLDGYVAVVITRMVAGVGAGFALAVFGGMIGALLMLFKRSVAYQVFIASLVGVLITMVHSLTSGISFGMGEILGIILMPILFAGFLIGYSRLITLKSWLK